MVSASALVNAAVVVVMTLPPAVPVMEELELKMLLPAGVEVAGNAPLLLVAEELDMETVLAEV